MKKKLCRKTLVMGLMFLFIGASIAVVGGQIETEKLQKDLSQQAPITITAGKPTKTGTWTVHITHSGTTTSGTPYTGTWTFTIKTNAGMSAADKAKKMRENINKRDDCPLTASGAGASVKVTPDNGKIKKWSSKSTDGQSTHGAQPKSSGFSFLGTPSTGSVSVEVDGCTASTTTDGKTLEEIHTEIVELLLTGDVNVLLDPSGLALYVFNISEYSGIDSDDDDLSSLGVFPTEEMMEEPFDVYVGMQGYIVENPGSTVTTSFTIDNFRFLPDTYEISVTDTLGWEIDPHYLELDFEPGQNSSVEIDITIPPDAFTTENIVNLTATSLTEPWINSSGLLKVIVNSPPEAPIIDGPMNGKAGTSYDYDFTATDPDGDDVKYYIDWGDGNTEWTGFSASGTPVTVSHTWAEEDTYTITAKAQDEYGLEGPEGTLEVTMPKNKPYVYSQPSNQQFLNSLFFQLLQRIQNTR